MLQFRHIYVFLLLLRRLVRIVTALTELNRFLLAPIILTMCRTSRKFFRRLLGKGRKRRTERPPEADLEAGPALLPVTVPACLPPEPYQHHHQFERPIDQDFELEVKVSDEQPIRIANQGN